MRAKRSRSYTLTIVRTNKREVKSYTDKSLAINDAIESVMFSEAIRASVFCEGKFITCYKAGIDYTQKRIPE